MWCGDISGSIVDRRSVDAWVLARQVGIAYLTFCRKGPISATRYPIQEAKQPRLWKPEPQTRLKSGSARLMPILYAWLGHLSVTARTLAAARYLLREAWRSR